MKPHYNHSLATALLLKIKNIASLNFAMKVHINLECIYEWSLFWKADSKWLIMCLKLLWLLISINSTTSGPHYFVVNIFEICNVACSQSETWLRKVMHLKKTYTRLHYYTHRIAVNWIEHIKITTLETPYHILICLVYYMSHSYMKILICSTF